MLDSKSPLFGDCEHRIEYWRGRKTCLSNTRCEAEQAPNNEAMRFLEFVVSHIDFGCRSSSQREEAEAMGDSTVSWENTLIGSGQGTLAPHLSHTTVHAGPHTAVPGSEDGSGRAIMKSHPLLLHIRNSQIPKVSIT